jgi:hypothetical protein
MWSPDEYFEEEVLVEGNVNNAVVEFIKEYPPRKLVNNNDE